LRNLINSPDYSLDLPIAILAGGLATRLRPITEKIPKSLVDVAGKPFLERQLRLLRSEGIRHAVLCLGHLAEQVQSKFGDGSALDIDITYSIDGATLLGTGGAIRKALPALGPEFLVTYGDSYLPVDCGAVVKAFRNSPLPALMTVYRNQNQWDKSNVSFTAGEIREYNKKISNPQMQHIDYGLMAFESSVFLRYPDNGPFDLAEVLVDLVRSGELAGFEVNQRFYEVGSPQGLLELSRMFTDSLSPLDKNAK
jgi:MurNAc alpha-1-phosphate uridylyltransferase